MGKIKNLVTEIQDEFTLSFDDAMAVTNKVLGMYTADKGVGTLFDDLRSVVDQYRGENNRLSEQVMALESEIAMLQQQNADHVRLNTLIEGLGHHEMSIEIPEKGEEPEATEWR